MTEPKLTDEQIEYLWMMADSELPSYTAIAIKIGLTMKDIEEFDGAWSYYEDSLRNATETRTDGRNFLALFLLAEAGEL